MNRSNNTGKSSPLENASSKKPHKKSGGKRSNRPPKQKVAKVNSNYPSTTDKKSGKGRGNQKKV